jgi:branched-chain amino acid transport system ATP-binding protein
MLELRQVDVYYGAIHALHEVSLTVCDGEIVTLIGANGAGKSTTLKTISGLLKPRRGEVWWDGERLDTRPAHAVVGRGIAHAPEGRRIFPNLTVYENLDLGAYLQRDGRRKQATLEGVYGLFPRLLERRRQAAGTLSGGEQQMLAIGRALMAEPRLLLLDEPSLGLAPNLVQEIFATVRRINEEGVTVLLVEQNAHMALRIARRGYVMETGRIVLEADVGTLMSDPRVREAYLGEEA